MFGYTAGWTPYAADYTRYLPETVPLDLRYDRSYQNPAGVIAMVVGIVVSVVLSSNQTLFTGLVPRAVPEIGDITFLVGIVLAAGLYVVLARRRITV